MREIKVSFNSIPMWAEDDRPREKMIKKGKSVLSDAELLAIIVGTGSGKCSAVDLARELLRLTKGDLHAFARLNFTDFKKVKGIGEAKAASILAAMELGRRRKENPASKKTKIAVSRDIYELLLPYFADLPHEEFYIVLVNKMTEVIAVKRISVGGFSGTFVDSKIIFKTALENTASGIILAHNHPSGNLSPSEQDERITKQLREFGKMIDLPILDHVIMTDNGYFSFVDNGKI